VRELPGAREILAARGRFLLELVVEELREGVARGLPALRLRRELRADGA